MKKFRNSFRLVVVICLAGMLLGNLSTVQVQAEPNASPINLNNPKQFQYVATTGHSISGAILRYYNIRGGLARHGLPLTEVIRYQNDYVQFFERSMIQFHPEYADSDAEVNLLPLGRIFTEGHEFIKAEPFESTVEKWYFPETHQSLAGNFLTYWRNNGAQQSFGLPISPELQEQLDGKLLTVQYFENVRLELSPDNSVQIGLLGAEKAKAELNWQLTAVPLAKLQEPRLARIPSLMFHYVRVVDRKKDELGFELSVTPENFTKFLDWVQKNNYNTVTISQILDYLKYGIPLPPKAVNLRFDDGYSSMWFAYQEMKKRAMTATFYVITRKLELLPDQWRQIDQAGFEVASHTRNHFDLRGVKDLESEIIGSKIDLELMLGHPVRTFSYPYGKFGPSSLKTVQNGGYELAVSTDGGYVWKTDLLYQQPAISIRGDDYVDGIVAKVRNVVEPVTPTKPTVIPPATPKK